MQQLERSLRGQLENHFDPVEIEQLARDKNFIQRESKLNGCVFLNLIVFNSNSVPDESLNDLTIALDKKNVALIFPSRGWMTGLMPTQYNFSAQPWRTYSNSNWQKGYRFVII